MPTILATAISMEKVATFSENIKHKFAGRKAEE
jgi:hypothetical protein